MASASDFADWWDKQRADTLRVLDQMVDAHPNVFACAAAAAVSTCMEVAAGTVDALRLGKGVAEKGWSGLGEDAMRLVNLPIVGGRVLGMAGKLGKLGIAAIAKRIPPQAIGAVTRCRIVQKAGVFLGKVKAVLGKDLFGRKTPPRPRVCTGGEPVSMITGEELIELEDFVWPGPLALHWKRVYRTTQSGVDRQLGHGWLTPLDEALVVDGDEVTWHDREGRTVQIPLPEPGGSSANPPEQLVLQREEGHLLLQVGDEPARVFEGTSGRCRLAAWRNRNGQSIALEYGEDGQVAALVASWNRRLLIQRAGTRIAAIVPVREQALETAPPKPLVRYEYDAQGDLARARDALDHGERYAYRNHMIARRTLASGFNFHFDWDRWEPEGRCLRSWGDDGIHDCRFEWEEDGISRVVDSRGGVTEYHHDENGLLLRETSPEGRTRRYVHDDALLMIASIDAAGRATRYDYDAGGQLVAVVDPLGQVRRFEHDAQGRWLSTTDALGQAWRRSYDAAGRLASAQDAAGGVTTFEYNEQGLPARIVDAMGGVRTLIWDEASRLVAEIGADGIRHRYQYDAADRIVAAITQDRRTTRYQYDDVDRLVAVLTPDGARTLMSYDECGRLVRFVDGLGHATDYRYGDGLDGISERRDPLGQVLRYHYDTERNLVGLTNAKGEVYRLHYDKDENLVEEIGFDGRVLRYRYGDAGTLDASALKVSGPGGQPAWRVTKFERDPLGRLLKKVFHDGTASEFGYDALGRMTRAACADHVVTFAYDALDAVVRETQGDAVISHEFDKLGRRTATVTPEGKEIRFERDQAGRVVRTLWQGQPLTQHRYDELGQEVARSQGNLVSTFDYDPMGRLARHQAVQRGAASPVLGRRYEWDPAGRVSSIEDLRHGRKSYVYDPADQLVEVKGLVPERFAYDPAANLVATETASGGRVEGNRLTMLGDRHFQYDEAGNLVAQRRGKGGSLVTRFAYDGDNQLVRIESTGQSSTYTYDALRRRIVKKTADGEVRFIYDGDRLLVESEGDQIRSYVFEPGAFKPLARVDIAKHENEAVWFYHLDHTGTPLEMTDVRGELAWHCQYRANGALNSNEAFRTENDLRFPGQYFDRESGLHYNSNRYYDPQIGRFITQDPIGIFGGINFYRYAPNPVNWIDPLGLACKQGGTYVLENDEGVVMRTGRSNDLARRELEHARDPALEDFKFKIVHETNIRAEQRGLEQLLHDKFKPPLNKVRPISPLNPRRGTYLKAADNYLNEAGVGK
jgi:RHS repeat-associated protein